METPKYLYHYTNIQSLALILKNKTIRFNSLDHMDDLQEKDAADLKNAGRYVYISSWTDDESESIPMWNMYASIDSGVRIKLKANPFKLYDNPIKNIVESTDLKVVTDKPTIELKTLIPFSEMFSKGFIYPMIFDNANILINVEYTDDANLLYPELRNIIDSKNIISLYKLGKYKNTSWRFQKEWRYRLLLLPINMNTSVQKSEEQVQQLISQIVSDDNNCYSLPFYDMQIDDAAFNEMEITLSPKISEGNRLIVMDLMEKYNPTGIVFNSSLYGLI